MATEYISRETAFESLNRIKSYLHQPHPEYSTMMFWEVEDFIETLPAADVVEVVRCRDCVNFMQGKIHGHCDIHCNGVGEEEVVKKDFFCAYGERK